MQQPIDKAKERDILATALRRYGFDAQLMVLIEECGELVQAAAKFKSGRDSHPMHVIEEIADVEIMIDQMRLKWGPDIDFVRESKLYRLADRLSNNKGEVEHETSR